MKILLIYNAFAAHMRSKKLLPDIKQLLAKKNIDIDLRLTDNSGHGIKLVEQADFSGYDGVVAAGGDGTLFEVINGYYRNRSDRRIPLGVIPTGTGNAFSRDLGIEGGDWKKAIDLIAGGKIKKFDAGKFKTNQQVHYFLNILGFGFVADVADYAHGLKKIGNFAYTLAVFRQLISLKPYHLRMIVDDKVIERENVFAEISNTRYTGVSFLMAPDAKINDGLLDIILLNKCSRTRLLKLFPTIFKGDHVNHPEVESYKARKIIIQTAVPKILTPDGELFGSTPIEVECLKQDIEVFCE
jgi:diacylglycerol kinase (ATP)